MLYQTGPEHPQHVPAADHRRTCRPGRATTSRCTRPAESILSWQPAVRVDYQAVARRCARRFKYSALGAARADVQRHAPRLQRHEDAERAGRRAMTASVNYTLTPTMFLEATYGHSQNELAGCAQAQSSTGPIFCTTPRPGHPDERRRRACAATGSASLPFLFPNATVLNPGYYAIEALNELQPAVLGRHAHGQDRRRSQWGSRVANAPPTIGFPGWFNINATQDFSISLTKVMGRHTFKTGFYNTHSYKAEQTSNNAFGTINFQQDAVGTNPCDTSFGFANAAIGTLQLVPAGAEVRRDATSVYNNTEGYIQDNWKVEQPADARLRRALRAPAGAVRHARPGVELPARQVVDRAGAGALRAGLHDHGGAGHRVSDGEPPGAESARRAQFLGPNSTLAIATLVPELRQHPERPVPARPGRAAEGDLLGAGARRRAALRHGVRRDAASRSSCCAAASACSSTGRARRRSRAASTIRRRRARSRCATRNCRASAAAA